MGFGTKFYKSGEKYVGQWENGEKNGFGNFTFPADDIYEREMYAGEWKDDNRTGNGTIAKVVQ